MNSLLRIVTLTLGLAAGCGGGSTSDADAAMAQTVDATNGVDTGSAVDAGADAMMDASADAMMDAGADAMMDAGADAMMDAGASQTACQMMSGYCTVQGSTCAMNFKLDTSISCDVRSLQCCLPL